MSVVIEKVDEDSEKDFYRGKNPEDLGPIEVVAQFVAHRTDGVIGEVKSAVVLTSGLERFKESPAELESFLKGLQEANILSKSEAASFIKTKNSSGTISMLKKIAEYQGELLDSRIRSRLRPGYSCLYQVSLLTEEVKKGQQGIERLAEILSERDGEISRAWIIKRREQLSGKIKTPKQPAVVDHSEEVVDLDADEVPSIQADITDGGSADKPEPSITSAPRKQMVTGLLLTVTEEQASRFSKELADNGACACVKVSGEIDANAVLLIDARADTLLSMSTTIGSLGFGRCVQAGLLSDPTGQDITASRMLAVYVRGSVELAMFKDWTNGVTPAELAGRILEGVGGRRVHLFADAETEGWESVVGDANWQR